MSVMVDEVVESAGGVPVRLGWVSLMSVMTDEVVESVSGVPIGLGLGVFDHGSR